MIASSQTQISLLSANKWLTDVLTEQDLKQIPAEVAELQQAKALVDQTLATLARQAAEHPELQGELGALNQLVKDYLQLTDTLPTEHQALLTRLYKVNQAKGQFQVSLPQFKKNLGDMMITIDDSFIKMLSETLTTKLSAIELSTMDALNQSIPAPIEAALKRNKMQIEGFNSTIKDLQGELKDFDNNMGHYVHGFVRDTTASDGVLAQYLALMQQQERMREQSKQASKLIVNIQSKLEQITAQSQQLMNNSIRASDHHLRRLEPLQRTQGQQLEGAGTGPNQTDLAHRTLLVFSSWVEAIKTCLINSLSISGKQVPQLLPQPSRAYSPARSLTPCRTMASTMRCSDTRRQEQISRLSPSRAAFRVWLRAPACSGVPSRLASSSTLTSGRRSPTSSRPSMRSPASATASQPDASGSRSQRPWVASRCHKASGTSDQEASRVQLPSGNGRLAHQSSGSSQSRRPSQSPCQRVGCGSARTRPCLNMGWPERGSTTAAMRRLTAP